MIKNHSVKLSESQCLCEKRKKVNMKNFIQKIFRLNTNKGLDKVLSQNLDILQKAINYKFKDIKKLEIALTHGSIYENKKHETDVNLYNERMEFLGDSVLGLVVSEHLYHKYPKKEEGDLSKIKANVVSEKFLVIKAQDFNLPDHIIMSEKEDKNDGRKRKSIISDTMESLICALYLDGGFEVAKKFIHTFILNHFEEDISNSDMINYKSVLQEYCQSIYRDVPEYKLVSEAGPDHQKTFLMEVYINSTLYGKGKGESKKEAQQDAAHDACQRLKLLK